MCGSHGLPSRFLLNYQAVGPPNAVYNDSSSLLCRHVSHHVQRNSQSLSWNTTYDLPDGTACPWQPSQFNVYELGVAGRLCMGALQSGQNVSAGGLGSFAADSCCSCVPYWTIRRIGIRYGSRGWFPRTFAYLASLADLFFELMLWKWPGTFEPLAAFSALAQTY